MSDKIITEQTEEPITKETEQTPLTASIMASLNEVTAEAQETRERIEDERVRNGQDASDDFTRSAEDFDYTYQPQGHLEIPEALVNEFNNKNFKLRWVRYMFDGAVDTKNWSKRAHEGWTAVSPSEVSSMQSKYLGVENADSLGDVIAKGDLILCKNEDYKVKARNDYYEQRADEQISGVNERLADQGMSQLEEASGRDRVHYNKSKSQVMTGKNSRKGVAFSD